MYTFLYSCTCIYFMHAYLFIAHPRPGVVWIHGVPGHPGRHPASSQWRPMGAGCGARHGH